MRPGAHVLFCLMLASPALAFPDLGTAPPADLRAARARCHAGSSEACLALEGASPAAEQKRAALVARLGACGADPRSCPPALDAKLSEACLEDGAALACAALGERLKAARESTAYFRVACALGYGFACNNVALAGDVYGYWRQARSGAEACERGSASACRDAALFVLMATHGDEPTRLEKQVPLWERGCALHDRDACTRVEQARAGFFLVAVRAAAGDPEPSPERALTLRLRGSAVPHDQLLIVRGAGGDVVRILGASHTKDQVVFEVKGALAAGKTLRGRTIDVYPWIGSHPYGGSVQHVDGTVTLRLTRVRPGTVDTPGHCSGELVAISGPRSRVAVRAEARFREVPCFEHPAGWPAGSALR